MMEKSRIHRKSAAGTDRTMQAFLILCLVLGGTLPSAHIGKVEGREETRRRRYTAATEAQALREELFGNSQYSYFDPAYDYDYTYITDVGAHFLRGGEQYKRPTGWIRLGLRVSGKYRDGDGWLGTGANAWPVSYHGTSIEAAKSIIQSHYKAGSGQAYGRGIYSSPDVAYASGYSKRFTSRSTGKTYDVVLQNRINPRNRQIYANNYIWLVPVPAGTSAWHEKEIVENSIRPYGLLLRAV